MSTSTVQHTPGPWHVGMKPGPIVYGQDGGQVADCRSVSEETWTQSHNARLIAAAPDLFAHLAQFVDYYTGQERSTNLREQLTAARALLARIEGA